MLEAIHQLSASYDAKFAKLEHLLAQERAQSAAVHVSSPQSTHGSGEGRLQCLVYIYWYTCSFIYVWLNRLSIHCMFVM